MSTKVDTYRVYGDRSNWRLVEPAAGRLPLGVSGDHVVAGQRPALPIVRLANVDTCRVYGDRPDWRSVEPAAGRLPQGVPGDYV
ncbi:TPA: hypothetical protein ACKP7W_001648, partial [Stenotrophomonas maltophilia]